MHAFSHRNGECSIGMLTLFAEGAAVKGRAEASVVFSVRLKLTAAENFIVAHELGNDGERLLDDTLST